MGKAKGWSGWQDKLLALGVLVIVGGGLWVGAGGKEAWHGWR